MSDKSEDGGSVSSNDVDELTTSINSESNVSFEGDSSRQQASLTSISPVDGEQEDKVIIAVPPKEREGSDYHTITLSGSSALDVLDQVKGWNGL